MEERRKKLGQCTLFKISTDRLIEHDGKRTKIVPLTLTKKEALSRCEYVRIQHNQLINKIFDYFKENNIPHFGMDLSGILVNVVVPGGADKKQAEKDYAIIAKSGFTLNGKKYKRLFSGSGQIRRNTITFIREDLYEPIFNSLLCGLTLDDFGKDFNSAKFSAYSGLNMSGCHLLPEELSPNVCIVDDYEEIRPHNTVNYVTEKEVKYITLPDEDYILTDDQTDFEIEDNIATRKSDGATFTIYKGVKKHITAMPYDEIEDSPALNSFDGQGLMSPEWAYKIKEYLGLDYAPSSTVIRAPWVKGLLANVPFHEWFAEHGITEITDSFGKVRQISEIDCIISKSQFKMYKIYKAKCERLGINAWDYHTEQMKANHLLWGVTKVNNRIDDDYKAMNYQYLQALQLNNEDIEELCKPTDDFLESLNSGDIETIYSNLMINGGRYAEEIADDENQTDETVENSNYKKLFQQVLEVNPDFINDKHIRLEILKECATKLNGAKLGKIFVKGNFQFAISDPVSQLEWITQHHCGLDIEVRGVIGAGQIYSNYWLNAEKDIKEIVLMRSPLIDRNEISRWQLITEKQHYYRYLASGIICSIHDLGALQRGGMDFDGDLVFSSNDPLLLKGCYDYKVAKPLYYKLQSTDLVGKITDINIIKADVRGLNSAVGQISNKAGSLYAMLQNYPQESRQYKQIYDGIIALGQAVGVEVDKIKTAISPTMPLEWKPIQGTKIQTADFEDMIINNEDEQAGIARHNEIVPSLKPYFFRFNYDYVDKALRDLDRCINEVCKDNFGYKLPKLIERCKSGMAEEAEIKLYEQYCRAYPVIDSDCIVNHICHHYEAFEKNLRKKTVAEGRNMLVDYVSKDVNLDNNLMNQVSNIVAEYQRFKRFLAKNANTNFKDNKKSKGKQNHEAQILMNGYYRDKLLELSGGELQLAFDMLVSASKGNEKLVWDILDDMIVRIIKEEN